MKCSLSNAVSSEYLALADEIKVPYKDRRSIPDLTMKYPSTKIALVLGSEIDWTEIEQYRVVCRGNLVAGVQDLSAASQCKLRDIPFYWIYPAASFAELQSLKRLGVCYAYLGESLFFQISAVKEIGVPIRAIANVAHDGYFPRTDGVTGAWIRPEDLFLYEKYIDIIEFVDANSTKEEALYRVYIKGEGWPADLDKLITNLEYNSINLLVPSVFTAGRLNCAQRCQMTGKCKLCYTILDLARPENVKG